MKEEWLMPDAVVPVDAETTAALVVEIKRLIEIVGDLALRQALAQPEQEPVAWGFRLKDGAILDIKNADEHEGYEKIYTVPLYTTPSNREWVGLTDEDKDELLNLDNWTDIVEAVEAKLKEKNT